MEHTAPAVQPQDANSHSSPTGKSSPTKTHQSLDIEIPVEASSFKKQKGKSVLSALTKPFKRKINDWSPEVAQSSKKTSVHQASPTLSMMQIPRSEIGEPPLTQTPSYISFESFKSGANFEADHLCLLLNASQEDLRLEWSRFEEREKHQAEMFERERQHYASRIRELEKGLAKACPPIVNNSPQIHPVPFLSLFCRFVLFVRALSYPADLF